MAYQAWKRQLGRLFASAAVATLLACPGALAQASEPQVTQKPAPAAPRPLLNQAQSAALTQALQQADRGQWAEARNSARATGRPVIVKYVDWLAYRDGGMAFSFGEVARFVAENPGWPDIARLRRSAEDRLGIEIPLSEAAAFFASGDAQSGPGAIRHVEILSATAGPEAARAKARQYWIELVLDEPAEQAFLAAVGSMLGSADHLARLDRLLWRNRTNEARRMLRMVDGDRLLWAEARIALSGRAGDADTRFAAVPAALRNETGLLFDYARYLRLTGRDGEAQALLLRTRTDAATLDSWWIERGYHARQLLKSGDHQAAYDIARAHDGARGIGFAELEFLSGWIALLSLNRPADALPHFQALHGGVNFPISLARGAYWSGRALEAMGNRPEAQKWYREAARYGDTYYGQLATRALGEARLALPVDPPVTAAQRRAFEQTEAALLTRLLAVVGEERRARQFLVRFAAEGSEGDRRLAGDLALQLGRPDISLQIAKRSVEGGTLLHEASFPNVRFGATLPIETAVALGLARQESQFDNRARSSAGALGVMQLMPATAQRVARSLGQPYAQSKLTSDAAYNARLGSAYLADMQERFGALELALAAYNAGPNRVSRWLEDYGDPRGERLDMIDWVELIPFRETRNYVQRVMEGVHVYRQILAGPPRRSVSPAMR